MNSALQRAAHMAHAQGMGDLSPELIGIINRGFEFGTNFINAKYAKDAAKFTGGGNFQLATPNNAASNAQALYELDAARRAEELASASVTADGIKFGNTRISWPTIAIFGVGVYLLQSQGFQRRGR